jgi:large subunit ribosomal protein L15
MKLKKRKKVTRMHGHGMGTHGWGARKKHISSGNQGGFGMSGTGKMAGHKKTLVTKLYGTEYFGKQGITSRGTERKKNPVMNVSDIVLNLETLKKKFGQKDGTLDLGDYKILGDGEITIKVSIKTKAASKSAIEKIEKAGGKVVLAKTEDKSEEKAE